MTTDTWASAVAIMLSMLLAGCVSAPRETLELVDVVAEQSASLETSHRALVELYFQRLEEDIDRFVDEEWAPDFLARAVASRQVTEAMEDIRAGMDLDTASVRGVLTRSDRFSEPEVGIIVAALEHVRFGYRAQFGQTMLDFSEAAVREINTRRASLKAPLREEKRRLLGALDESYADLVRGQAALRAYLASVVELVESQDRALQRLDLIDERDAAMDAALEASDTAANIAALIERVRGAHPPDGALQED